MAIGCRKIRWILTNKYVDEMQGAGFLKGYTSLLSQGVEDPKHCLVQLWRLPSF